MFLLQSDGRTEHGFAAYREYLHDNRARFPTGALRLAQSDWYYASFDHRGPHDGRLDRVSVSERPGPGAANWHNRSVSLELTLRSAYDDGDITLRYPTVHSYTLDGFAVGGGHADWRYDELRLDDAGRLVHEIEWGGGRDSARWLVVADDIELSWHPDDGDMTVVTQAAG